MSRTLFNFWLDALLLVLFLALLWVSVVIRFVFPHYSDAAGWMLWGANYGQWSQVRFVILCMFALCVLVHVTLHWNWVCGVAARFTRKSGKPRVDTGSQTIIGVGLLIVLLNVLGFGIAVAALTIQAPAE